ncbi:MAG: AMP-binding protein [Acidobacteriaceae bacterium]|nr:AMP-binding protein [Acidobacteriaceae bacterium]
MRNRNSLASLLDDFRAHPSDIAAVAPRGLRQQRTSYGELAILAQRFAAELEFRGIAKGDRILIWGENSAEWIATFFGCVLRGVLAVPVDAASAPEFVRRVEAEVAPKLIAGSRDKLQALGSRTPLVPFEAFKEKIAERAVRAIDDLKETDPLQIVFTSGTTGEPKGVVHTHKNVLASLRPIEQEAQKYLKYEWLVHPIRILHTLPLSHVFGQFMGLWIPPILRAEVHYEPRLVAAELIERVRRERISVLAAVPRVLELLEHDLFDRFPGLALRLQAASGRNALQRWWAFRDVHAVFGWKLWAFVCGGASLAPELERFWNALGFVVIQGYGMTETTALVSLNHPFRAAQGTIGQVLPGREVRLAEDGEVFVRGDTISRATWQHGAVQQQDSAWLATGDLAEFDANGNLRFRGRKKDVIVTSSGLNIFPEDLEAALQRQPGVKAATVIETASDHGPEPLAALIVNGQGDAHAAVAGANRELAEFQHIRRWLLWPEPDLPRTTTGKVLRREVARRIAIGEVRSDAQPESEGELNLDSLGRVELQARLEQQYGVSLDDAALQQVRTGEEIRKLLAASTETRTKPAEHSYPHWPWHPLVQALRSAFLEAIAMPLVRLLAKPRVESTLQDFPSPPLLIVANHVTSYDVPFILYALPGKIRRKVAVAMSGEMILDWRRARNQGHWFLNLVAPFEYLLVTAFFNIFPLPQLSGFRRSFRHAGEAVDRGYSVVIFPEGRRSDDGTPQQFKPGAGMLWKELGVAALPVRLEGLGEIKARHSRWFRSGKISVHVGRILPLNPEKSPEELTEMLRRGVFDHRSAFE